eukprot:SAG31_NODE_4905_length_2875_cov_2.277017_4_plen_84_part_00
MLVCLHRHKLVFGLSFALDAFRGVELWRYSGAGEELNGSPSLTNELVFVGSNDKYMHVLDKKTGGPRLRAARDCRHSSRSRVM